MKSLRRVETSRTT